MTVNGTYRERPLVTVVITSYNHALYLDEAIQSVISQTYSPIEIIVVDDGSTDNTRELVERYETVNYVYQSNSGLSTARNTGIKHAKGEFIVFLDADDWLYHDAVQQNVLHLLAHADWQFVSGGHDKVDGEKNIIQEEVPQPVESNHYLHLLQGNYIGMHATVMYRKSILKKFQFDDTLKACEDYDLYLRIARDHSIGSHGAKLAAYRIHGNNMSSRIPFMLESVLNVCKRQRPLLRSSSEKKAYNAGLRVWTDYYSEKLYNNLMYHPDRKLEFPDPREAGLLLRNKPFGFVKLSLRKTRDAVKSGLKNNLPDSFLKKLHSAGMYVQYTPKPGKVEAGDFNRTTPFSYDFGFDRGGAVDRYYIENFLSSNSHLIKGRVLEIGDNEYTLKFGQKEGLISEILHVDRSNPKATYVGDITNIPEISDDRFDCIIMTQTLHLIYDFRSALKTCNRILKPGGSLLITVPGISHIDHGLWKDYWLWSFTDKSMNKLLSESFGNHDISTFGNVYVAAAFLYGMGLPELKEKQLLIHDPSYQVIIAARAIKE